MKWQAIDTAPTGERMILYYPSSASGGTRRPYWEINHATDMIKVDVHPVTHSRKPTHWMPLPPPPAEQEKKT